MMYNFFILYVTGFAMLGLFVCLFVCLRACLFFIISDQGSTYSGDLESEAVSTPHSWEEELNHYALKSNTVQEADLEVKQFSKGETEQDLEADFPSGLFTVT